MIKAVWAKVEPAKFSVAEGGADLPVASGVV